MKVKILNINRILLIFISSISILLVLFGALFKIMHWSYFDILLITGLVLSILIWLIVLIDIFKSTVRNKILWLFLLLFAPSIASLVYLIIRADDFLVHSL